MGMTGEGRLDSGSFSLRIEQNGTGEPVVIINDTLLGSGSFETKSNRLDGINGQFEISVSRNGSSQIAVQREEYIDWVEKRSDEFLQMREKMINEIYRWEGELKVSDEEIYKVLEQELNRNGIFAPFRMALYENGKIRGGDYNESQHRELAESRYKSAIFADRFIRNDISLSLVFPGEGKYIMGSMATIIGGSILFSLIIFLTFILSIFFILRQKKISEMKSDFINNMTHEFKTPLATISLAADTITNPKVISDEGRVKHFVEMIKKENLRMNKQVETILQIATLEKREMEFTFESVSIHAVLRRAVDTVSIQVEQKGGWINSELKAEKDVVFGDFEHLTNLVHNLLDNANKYSNGAPEITLITSNNDKGVTLRVEDRGIGLNKSVQTRIFERFYRESTGNVHNVKGFGLGLNYVRAIVDAHNGTIRVDSEPLKGTQFTIFIPFNGERE